MWLRFRLRSVTTPALLFALGSLIYLLLSHNTRTDTRDSDVMAFRRARFTAAQNRPPRDGPGENGKGVVLTAEEQKIADLLFKNASFNVYASDKVALDRSIPDTRRAECKTVEYPADLPTISAILIFNNEALSAILRTVHSIVNRTPPQYLHEVILLDDCSDHEELHKNLDDIVAASWPDGIVKIVRRETRGGLVKARVSGARAASGDTIIIMDAHMEVNVGWCEPMLHHLKKNPTHLVVPVIDVIMDSDLRYGPGMEHSINGFSWAMAYTWMDAPKRLLEEQRDKTDPIKTFAMVGCVFAMNRDYFFHIGAFDEGMSIWGGENVELPLRVWMCGGAVVLLPCSHIAHLYRKTHPFTWTGDDAFLRNAKRTAEVWLDEYKRLFYRGKRPGLKDWDVGDLTERIELRKRLNCHSFKWFLQNIYPEKFIPDENVLAFGTVRNEASGLCLDIMNAKLKDRYSLYLNTCKRGGGWEIKQQMSLTKRNHFRMELRCFARLETKDGVEVISEKCSESPTRIWYYDKEKKTMRHEKSGHCMHGTDIRTKVTMKPCDGSPQQQWIWEKLFF